MSRWNITGWNAMKKYLLMTFLIINAFITNAQDLIILKDGREIHGKVIEITSDKVKYNREDNLSGPVYVQDKNSISEIQYENGTKDVFSTIQVRNIETSYVVKPEQGDFVVTKAEEWRGDYLPRIAYGKVYDPEKGKIKRRYYGEGVVFREKEFKKFLELYCLEAYQYETKATTFLVLECCFIWSVVPCIVFGAIAINYSAKVLPTYNNACAGLPIQQTIRIQEPIGRNDSGGVRY